MSNVIHVRFPSPEDRRANRLGPVISGVASSRRSQTDAFWLKENGELLNVLETSGTHLPKGALGEYQGFYESLPERLAFFPQYYRFILSIALDLEAHGMDGALSERLCDQILSCGLVEGETSDIQRLEAQRLLARRGREAPIDPGVAARARAFINSPGRFALPNKKAAYELTHIVFYLTEYGRRDVDLGQGVAQSLENVGNWAYLDGNLDLLAEICIAMRFLSYNPVEMWESWIAARMQSAKITYAPGLSSSDSFHCVLMGAWLGAVRGTPVFSDLTAPQPDPGASAQTLILSMPPSKSNALGELSRHLFTLGARRSGEWDRMEPLLADALSDDARDRLRSAANASGGFARFFESFARAVPA